MNTLSKKILFIVTAAVIFTACKKNESVDYFQGGTAPALTANVSDSIPMSYATASQNAVAFTWTNPNYQFASGISSQDVSYLLEIDTLGANFTNPNRVTRAISKDLSVTFTQSAFNTDLLNQMVLLPGVAHTLQVRITASIAGVKATNLASNILKFKATPYTIPPAVTPPASGKLFITGSATAHGWMVAGDAEVPSQEFTKISETLYQITVALIGGQSYTFVPIYGDWTTKYSIAIKNDPTEVNGGDFQVGGNDILAPASSATYDISVDFQRGKFTVTKH